MLLTEGPLESYEMLSKYSEARGDALPGRQYEQPTLPTGLQFKEELFQCSHCSTKSAQGLCSKSSALLFACSLLAL
jgi:hypothetical protein